MRRQKSRRSVLSSDLDTSTNLQWVSLVAMPFDTCRCLMVRIFTLYRDMVLQSPGWSQCFRAAKYHFQKFPKCIKCDEDYVSLFFPAHAGGS